MASLKRLWVIGSSHANRLFTCLLTIPTLNLMYITKNITKNGSSFSSLLPLLPDPFSFDRNDLVIVQVFGNSLFHRFVNKRKNVVFKGRQICLKTFSPLSSEEIRNQWNLAAQFFGKLPCKILLIDNPFRHTITDGFLNKNVYIFQKRKNMELRNFFQTVDNVKVINHLTLLPYPRFWCKNWKNYGSLLGDSVHFHPNIYQKIALKLWSYIQSENSPLEKLPPVETKKQVIRRKRIKRLKRIKNFELLFQHASYKNFH